MDQKWLQTCPVCEQDNQCAMAAGQPNEECWCVAVRIEAVALAAIPPESRGKRCLCRDCAIVRGDNSDAR